MKLTVLGGGSTYTPELIDGIARRRTDLDIDEIALVDPDEQRLSVIAPFCRRMLQHAGHPARVTATDDLDAGAQGATAVLIQLRVGGQEARLTDETFPHECGCIGQETTGAGGLAKALRTVPVVLDLARRIRDIAGEHTWLVNFTNPVGIVTRALLQDGHHAVGLCNVAITYQRMIAGLLDVDPHRVGLDHAGLNHLSWELAAYVDGVDRLPELLEQHADPLAERSGSATGLLHRLGSLPSPYLRYFYAHDEQLAEQRVKPPRAETVRNVEQELLRTYADPATVTKPEQLTNRGGAYYSEAAIQLVHALTSGHTGEKHVVNVPNRGTLPFLPDDAVIETPCTVSTTGAEPTPLPSLPPSLRGLVAHVTAYEHLALDAATHGGRDRVADALLAHPLIGQHAIADRLADMLVARNAGFLPWATA